MRVVLLLIPLFVFSQNILSGGSLNVNENTSYEYEIGLDNDSAVSALQFDIDVNQDAFSYGSNHLLTTRASGFTVSSSNPSENIMRVVMYSSSGGVIEVGSGTILKLDISSKTLPDDYTFSISNVVLSDATGTELSSSSSNGTVSVRGARLNVNTTSIDFGRVPIGENEQRSISISNNGNENLTISAISFSSPLSLTSTLPLTINPGGSQSVSIALDSSEKYDASSEVSFTTNDNDGLRQLQKTTVSANVYAVNEIHIGSGSGEIHTDISIPVSINNMEPFSGFQFDLTLPQDISYVENSVELSTRKSDHSVSGSLINANTLRVIAYSNTNAEFSGSDGEVMSFKLKPEVSSGNYNLTISNPIISNITLGDIESDSYNGSVQINAPNLVTNPSSISFGRVPITETKQQVIRLTNNGSAELSISSIVKDVSLFDIDTTTPFTISQGSYKDITLTFTPSSNGNVDQDISIRHNGSTEQNIINVTADVFSPNYLKIKDVSVDVGGTSILEIELHNNDEVRGIQFDVTLNSEFNYDVSNYELIDNGTIFSSSTSSLGNNKHRFILYNTSGNTVPEGSGAILKIPFTVLENTSWGDYTVDFSNVVISGPNNTSVGSEALNSGKVTVTDVTPPSISGETSIDVSEGNNSVIETFTANESVTWSLAQSDDYSSFNIDPNTGELSFNATPDYESPLDDNTDNIYSLKILATDAYNNVGTLDVQITVINVNEPPNGTLTVNTTEVGEDWAIISWSYTEGSNPITGFRLWVRKGRGGSWNAVTVLNQFLDPEVRSYRLEGLDSGQLYAFRLWPTNSEGKDTSAGEPGFTTEAPDTTAPVITLLGDATVTIEVGSDYTDAGATASDNYDGDITNDIVVENPVDTAVVGTYTVTYNVSDAAGNTATQVTRTVNVVDTTAPVITLLGDATINIEVGSDYTDAGATASDNYDGDITNDIVVENPVDTGVVGTYTVTYNVSDAAGNTAVEVFREVVVENSLTIGDDLVKSINIYPNPFSEIVNISSKILVDISVYNILGSEVLKEDSVNVLNTSALKQGVYIFKIEYEGLETYVKMVK